MAPIRSVTKAKQLQEVLREQIISGDYQVGEKFHSQNELARMYEISHVTAREAVGALEQEGLLRRVQGKGTFVERISREMRAQEMVGLVVPTTGHLFGPLSSRIVRELTDYDHVCFLIECPPDRNNTTKLQSVIERAPGFLVVDGLSNIPLELLESYDGHLVFVHSFDYRKQFSADRVLCDFQEAGRLAVDHLLAQGHCRVVMLTYAPCPEYKSQGRRIQGAREAFREHGVPQDNLTVLHHSDAASTEEVLREVPKPVGVFADGDFRAKWVYSAARKHGWNIPEDVSVVGFYDTPWCEALHPNLTSVSVREGRMAREVVRIITEQKDDYEEVLVAPELVVRESCGGSDGLILGPSSKEETHA